MVLRSFLALTLLAMGLMFRATPADFSGTWKGVFEAAGVVPFRLVVTREGTDWKAEARITDVLREFSNPVQDLKIDGDKISFYIGDLQRQFSRYTGTRSNDTIEGTFEIVRGGQTLVTGNWIVKRTTQIEDRVPYKPINSMALPGASPTPTPSPTPNIARGQLPAPTGQFAVAKKEFFWKDSSRPEVMTEDLGDYREMMVTLWYPA